jgi:hypothetical protein
MQAPAGNRYDQVQDPKQVPADEGSAGREARSAKEGECNPRRSHPDRDVAQAGRPGEGPRQHPVHVQSQEPQGGVPGSRTNAPAAPSRRITTNQRASTPTMIGLMPAPRLFVKRALWRTV